MAYKIQYTPEAVHRYPMIKKRKQINLVRWVPLLLLLVAAVCMRIYGIPDFLIPGDPQITRAAAAVMLDEIGSGVSVNEAVTVFCKQILNGAGV